MNLIRIWNSIAYNYLPLAKKLESCTKTSILIDYNNSNQYKLLTLKTKLEYWSRDVIIFKKIFINQKNNLSTNIFNEELKMYMQTYNNSYLSVDKQNFNNISLRGTSKNQARTTTKNSIKQNAKLNLSSSKKAENTDHVTWSYLKNCLVIK